VRVGEGERGLRLDEVLKDLVAARGVQSVLVEGGGRTLSGFLCAGVACRAVLFHAPLVIGARGATPMFDGAAVGAPSSGWGFKRERVLALGPDQCSVGRWVPPRGEV
jgi:riboflavin biosynthesis pyrimidine reductase